MEGMIPLHAILSWGRTVPNIGLLSSTP